MHDTQPASRSETAYLVRAFGISWLIWLPLVLSSDGLHLFRYSLPPWWVALGTAGPVVASLWISKRDAGRWLASRFFPPLRPGPLLNVLTAPILILASIDLLPYLLCTQAGLRSPHWSDFTPLLYLWPDVLGGPLGEEFGWRGFLLPCLTARFGPSRATLLLSLIWTAWHLPLFLVHAWISAPVWFFCVLLVATSFIMTLGYNLTGGSILAAILAHFTFNCTAAIFGNLLAGAQTKPNVDPFHIVLITLVATALALILITKGRLGLPKVGAAPANSTPLTTADLE